MARVCTVCAHPDAVAMNEEIVLTRRGNRSIAKRYGVDDSAVQRHKDHIPQLLVKARDDFEAFEAEAILQSIEDLQRETLTVLEEAKDGDKPDHKTILAAIREQRGNLELVAKIKQLIDKAPTINNLIYDSAFISV